MQNPFYYSNYPFTNIPNSFYSLNRSMRNIPIRSTFNFNTFLESAQKGINTINQIIPLYKQIKPIYSEAKNSLQSVTKYLKNFQKKIPNMNRNANNSYTSTNTNSNFNTFHSNNGPSTPFF